MKCLVTGAAGFIGAQLAVRLAERGDEVVGIDSFLDSYPREVKEDRARWIRGFERIRFVEGDLMEADLEELLEGVEVVFHQAAQAGVRASWGQTFEVYARNNILATQRLLEACRTGVGLGSPTYNDTPTRIRRFVYASSSSVYGDNAPLPTPETAATQPYSPYGVTKLAGEHLAMLYWANFGVPAVALRYFTVFGPRPRPDMAFCRFARAILAGQPIRVFGTGEQSRGFTHVSDVVEANLAAVEKPCEGEVINIGGGASLTVNEVVACFEEIIGKPAIVEREDVQKGDVRHTMADVTKAKRVLDWEARKPFMEGLAELVESVEGFYGL
ncbi:MAG: NAD-dependent epimerase/dehydratase family protein [Armatimonadetes bacterium]|nr:NAD-dependent epimerase/dehydratase family protein [Armatimonadota bacterium]